MAVSEDQCCSAKSGSSLSASPARSVHYLAKCVLRGSVVLQVVYGHIRSPSSLDVVFGKETSIELVIISKDGIVQSVCEQPVFGTVKDLSILHWNENFHGRSPELLGKDLLVVISDSGKLSILTFCNEMHRFFPVTHVQLSNPGNSRQQLGRMLSVDSSGCFIAASAYEDRLALFSISVSAGSDLIDKRIFYPPENEGDKSAAQGDQPTSICGTIWSMCFISRDYSQPSKEHCPLLAIILTRRGSYLNELLLMEWNKIENSIQVISQYLEAGPLALNIVEVPHSQGFAFLFRIGDVLLLDLRDAHNPCRVSRTSLNLSPAITEGVVDDFVEPDVDDDGLFNVAACALLELRDYDPMYIDEDRRNPKSTNYVCSWSWEPGNNISHKMIFCADTGDILMIEISFDSDEVKVNLSDSLYKGQPCKALLWVEGGFLAALVEMGDGMVLKFENGQLLYTSPIQNIAPILDVSFVDFHDEKHDEMFACCGVEPEGSLRIIRTGISVEKLLKTSPIYQGITGTWTVRMKMIDSYHSFLVLSFVEQTRVLSVGLSFTDVTDSVGFQPDVSTLACGLVGDGLLVQIHQRAVRLCLPTKVAHSDGIPSSSPMCTSWSPDAISISLGAVGHNLIVVATSNPCFLFILGVRSLSAYHYEIFEMQHVKLQCELSCISIAQKIFEPDSLSSSMDNLVNSSYEASFLFREDICRIFVIGTHKPSVEILSFLPDKGLRVLASGFISLKNAMGTAISGCIPQDVRLVLADQFYVLSGLRNGMLLRFEWPAASSVPLSKSPGPMSMSSCFVNGDSNISNVTASNLSQLQSCAVNLFEETKGLPVNLQVIATRHIGITPVFLVPLSDSLDTDIIVLSDRPWLLQTARHSLSYSSISFQPSTHVTPVCSVECPNGILFVADNSLNLVEMVQSKRLNVQKFHLKGTPRRVLYHNESRLLIVMRTDLTNESSLSDICCVDPLSGSVRSSFKLELGETGKSMELVRVGNEQVVVIGTSLFSGPAIMPSGEAESSKGRLIVLCLENVPNSDSGSMICSSKPGYFSQRISPFRGSDGYVAEQLSSSSLSSSPDDTSCDGIKHEETEAWEFRLAYSTTWPGVVLAICPYLDRYFLASAGSALYVCNFPNDNPQKVRRIAVGRTRFMITSLTVYSTRIAVGDCRDGILFYSYHEDSRKLEQLYCDPSQRLIADCILMDVDTAVVSDRKGSISVLTYSDQSEENASPECNLTVNCAYYMGEIAMRIKRGSFSYKLPSDDTLKGCDGSNANIDFPQNTVVASTLLGSMIIFLPISREEHELLEAVQARLAVHPLTAPILGNDHNEFRGRENPVGVPKILDGDILAQFLELTSRQQEAVLASPPSSTNIVKYSSKLHSSLPIPINQVVQLLERIHYALN